jgi:hypothetical protein
MFVLIQREPGYSPVTIREKLALDVTLFRLPVVKDACCCHVSCYYG